MDYPISNAPKAKPFIKWVGGKSKLISQYQEHIPDFNHYYEPFLGGGAMFFHLRPKYAFLSDINEHLIWAYRCVRDEPEYLLYLLGMMQKQHSKEYYYQVRNNPENEFYKIAARFIYLNKTCFNGLWRENQKGENNVPIGDYKNPKICDRETILAASKALQEVPIKPLNYTDCTGQGVIDNAFFFLDPPYVPIKKDGFTAYNKSGFTFQKQRNLKKFFSHISERGANVMLANSDCDFIRDLYKEFRITSIGASRSVNSDPTNRGKVNEVIVTNY